MKFAFNFREYSFFLSTTGNPRCTTTGKENKGNHYHGIVWDNY